ncbi:winged helix-turn-helix transcriptional regulator [Paradesertivirga mongoliensis]|uniref:Winged helix-turn-helix transcriptional regulator n=1 Tax=Paradesertivirga mongoliensis TaxID=2100740 RepID=A0ABW4ZMQ0_9SPHI|nr:helix-turn-helix domain-containing protein [Pedobacter mongoliensis]
MKVTIGNKELEGTQENAMDHFSDNHSTNHYCPVTDVIDRISDKWSVHAIILLGKNEKLRFGELKKGIHGISQRMLTVTLKHLEQDGLLTRTVFPQIPPKVEYQLTELGRSLLGQLIKLSEWASENMVHILRAREEHILKND